MGFVEEISVNLDVVANNAAKLAAAQDGLPTQTEAARVSGANAENAQSYYRSQLARVAGTIAQRVELVRVFVSDHADALRKAASALQESDASGAQSSDGTTASVESLIGSAQPQSGCASPTDPSRAAGGSGAAGGVAADPSRDQSGTGGL
jgi:hypothetical protein